MEPTYTQAQWVAGTIAGIIAIALAIVFIVGMFQAAFPTSFSDDCEHLYNEYTSTVNMNDRAEIFQIGLDNGCFHYN